MYGMLNIDRALGILTICLFYFKILFIVFVPIIFSMAIGFIYLFVCYENVYR